MKKNYTITIAVICGGPSKEAEVSRSTSAGIVKALHENYKNVHLIELDQYIDQNLRKINPDVVFPAVHGKWGEDGHLQGYLTMAGFPYVGCGMEANVLAMNKILSKQIFKLHGLPVADYIVINPQDDIKKKSQHALDTLGKEIVVKPACEGSSIGVSFANNLKEVATAVKKALDFGFPVLIERRVYGAEITAGILDQAKPTALPVIEIKTPPGTWYDYEHRYTPGLSEHILPAPLPPEQYRRVQEIALAAHLALGCQDLSRADFVVPKQGEPILLEVNTLPGMTPTSLFPDATKAIGISFPDLVSLLVERAFARSSKFSRD
ncbi:MAG: D-alanine--D-alanine ligase [Proteobacteria bacterium]|nr:D-alanine--D-alanine ligase [Pseudomonadota bacterium]